MRITRRSGGGSSGGSNSRYYDIVVGNAQSGDTLAICDYLDTGNGMQLKVALAAAGAAGPLPKSVFVRRGSYDLGAAGSDGVPITIPALVLCQCDRETVFVASADPATTGTLQTLIVLGQIRDFALFVPTTTSVNPSADVSFMLITDAGDARDYSVRSDGQSAGFSTLWGATFIGALQLATAGNASRSERAFIAQLPSRLIDGDNVGTVAFRIQGDSDDQTTRNVDLFLKSTESGGTPRVPDIGLEIFNANHVRVERPTLPGARTNGLLVRANAFTSTDIEIAGHRVLWTEASAVQRLGVQLLSEAAGVIDGAKIGAGFIDCFSDTHASIGIDIHSTGAGSSTSNCEIDGSDMHNFAEGVHVESVAAGSVDANGVVNTRVSDNAAGINNVNDVNFRLLGNW